MRQSPPLFPNLAAAPSAREVPLLPAQRAANPTSTRTVMSSLPRPVLSACAPAHARALATSPQYATPGPPLGHTACFHDRCHCATYAACTLSTTTTTSHPSARTQGSRQHHAKPLVAMSSTTRLLPPLYVRADQSPPLLKLCHTPPLHRQTTRVALTSAALPS
jgi:hypothetical protein